MLHVNSLELQPCSRGSRLSPESYTLSPKSCTLPGLGLLLQKTFQKRALEVFGVSFRWLLKSLSYDNACIIV